MEKPKVSVIVPIYNVEKYVRRCLDSLLQQSLPDIEIICVEDRSTDASLEIVREYQCRDDRITVLQNLVNSGLSYTRNRGIERAQGKYLCFLDSDDWLILDALEKLYVRAEQDALDIVYFDSVCVYENAVAEAQAMAFKIARTGCYEGVYTGTEWFQAVSKEWDHIAVAWNCLLRCGFVREHRISFYEGILHEDNLFYFQSVLQAKRVGYLKQQLHFYYRRLGAITLQGPSCHRFKSFLVIFCEAQLFACQHVFPAGCVAAIKQYVEWNYTMVCSAYEELVDRIDSRSMEDIGFSCPTHELVYRMFLRQFQGKRCTEITQGQIARIREFSSVIIYGAGIGGHDVMRLLDRHGVHRFYFAVTDASRQEYVMGNLVHDIRDFISVREECIVLLSVIPKYHGAMLAHLRELGFKHVMIMIDHGE